MPSVTITGDCTQEALEKVLLQGIGKYGKEFNVIISPNLRFENQNHEIKEQNQKIKDYFKERFSNIGHDAFRSNEFLLNCKCERCSEYFRFMGFIEC